jgi:hypothetical protein
MYANDVEAVRHLTANYRLLIGDRKVKVGGKFVLFDCLNILLQLVSDIPLK